MEKLIYEEESYVIRGAVFEVYRVKGCGFLEPVYQECLEKEFKLQQVPFEPQKEIRIDYKGEWLTQSYKPDFICHGKIIVELKAVKKLLDEHRAQLINYLKAADMRLGFLVNYNSYPQVEIERFVN